MPIARAVWIIASAPRMPPVFASLTFTPSTQPFKRGQIACDERVFVGDDRNRDALAYRAQLLAGGPPRIGCSQSSISKRSSSRRICDGALDVPAFVGVDAQRAAVARADRGDRFDLLGRRAAAELDLEDRMIAGFGHFRSVVCGIGDADRKRRRRRRRRIEPEQCVERLAELLADQVVQREVEAARARPAGSRRAAALRAGRDRRRRGRATRSTRRRSRPIRRSARSASLRRFPRGRPRARARAPCARPALRRARS